MNDKQNRDLDALSGIKDEIIDKNTVKRALLKSKRANKRPQKLFVALIAAALVITVLLSAFVAMLFAGGNKQVPVYEGMTVLDNYQGGELYYPSKNRFALLGSENNGNNGDNGNHFGHDKKPSKDVIEEDMSVTIPEQDMYYANPGQDIYINVHISNPDNFEILSFTLNGKKYSSYMFEEGSDMENLVLKVNVGDVEGVIVEYTIDAIKYVDGTEIKDVIMEGDRTIKVGVFTEDQPVAQISNEDNSMFELSFDVSIKDNKSLIETCEGSVFVVLIDNSDTVVGKKELVLGETNHIVFDGLDGSSDYRRVIAAYYDAYDGEGFALHILDESEARTEEVIKLTDLSINGGKVTFNLYVEQKYNIVIEKIDLIGEGRIIQSIGPEDREFTDINYIGEYYVSVSYSYKTTEGEIKVTTASEQTVRVEKLSDVSLIVPDGEIGKPYSEFPLWSASMADWREHLGIDIIPSTNDKSVLSASVGTVSAIIDDKYGRAVIVEVKLGDETVEFRYESLNGIVVEVGDVIVGGQKIGNATADNQEIAEEDHVHFSVYENGEPIDPQKYVYYEVLPEYQ